MAKAKPPNPFTLRKWILKYPKELKTDGSVIYCNVCDKALQAYKKHHVDQHVLTGAHKNAAAAKSASTRKTSQALIAPSEKGGASNSFHMDLVKMLISANIPIYKVNNSVVRAFFKKYMQQHLPDESTLRKLYLTPCYEQVIQDIREDIGDNCLYVAVDETTDCMGRYMAHVVVGKLDGIAVSIPHLLLCRQLSNANSACVARLVDEAMCVLWPEGKHAERLVLFLSDAAPYMVKTGKDLSIFYPNLTHVTCLAHGLHRVAETIRSHAKSTNKLVSSVRKIFCKAPQRVALFQSANPGLKLPPEPVLTRWGTWVAAVSYYAENFDKVAAVIKELNPKDADAISKAQAALELPGIREEVALFVAIENNDRLILQQLLRFGATPIVYLENINKYPIFTAAERPGCFDVLQQLIAHSHNDLHFCDQNGFRALERALLVHRSRPASGFTNNARTVSFLIDQMEPEKLLKVCVNRKTTLHIAAESHDSMLFSRFLNAPNIGDFINYQDINGNTVCHLICAARDLAESDQLLMLNYLRTRGAVAVPNDNGDLPYQLAQSYNVANAARELRCIASLLSRLTPSLPRPPPFNHSLTSSMASAQGTAYIQNAAQTSSTSNVSQIGIEVIRELELYNELDHIPSLYEEANLHLRQACFDNSVSEFEHGMSCGDLSNRNVEITRTPHRPLPPPPMDIEREVARVSQEIPIPRTAIHKVTSGFPAVRNDIQYVSQGFPAEQADIHVCQVRQDMSGNMNLAASQPLSVNVSNEFEAYVLQNQLVERDSPYSVSSSSASDTDAQFEVALDMIKHS